MVKSGKFLFVLLLGLVLIGGVSALSCNVVSISSISQFSTSCSNTDGSYHVLGLYGDSNTHGASNGSVGITHVLCCNEPTTNRSCDSQGQILHLSSQSNAHGEVFNQNNYGGDICFGDNIECASFDSSSASTSLNGFNAEYNISMLSLSSLTNAHLGEYDYYPVKIACREILPPNPNALWKDSSGNNITEIVYDGTPLTIYLALYVGIGFSTSYDYQVYESDFVDGLVAGLGTIQGGECPAGAGTLCNNANYYYASYTINDTLLDSSSPDLGPEVDNVFELYFIVNEDDDYKSTFLNVVDERVEEPSAYWGDFLTNQEITSLTYDEFGTNQVYLVIENTGLSEGEEIEINIYDEDDFSEGLIDDEILQLFIYVNSNGDAIGNWTITASDFDSAEDLLTSEDDYYEFYFTNDISIDDSPILNTTYGEDPIQCVNIDYCSNYNNSIDCGADSCNVANNNSNLPAGIVCDEGDINCYCSWDNSGAGTCNSAWSSGAGSCEYNESTSDTCADGFLSYSWDAVWNWSIEGFNTDQGGFLQYALDSLWYNDPTNQSGQCQPGQNIIACPASVQLPFFTFWNLIGVIVLITLIYLGIGLKKKKVSKNKK